MSNQVVKQILKKLDQWPMDSVKHYASFRDTMIEHYEPMVNQTPTKTEQAFLEKQNEAFGVLLSDKYMKKFPLTAVTLEPPKDPEYYSRLVQDIGAPEDKSLLGKLRQYIRF
ncbi:hypothetical protein B0I72DRAFT_139434 [Yarrowia lipolytica]|uniref:Cytochrome B pre-mRNA-processing protein 6 n=1 Tax=Yarrowia lipolytica TaxID=4952 RepID=A0A371BY60_YARLL|nr:hypothetical protein BKA91DRAFT_137519 [Yarrowia lipolytica]KAE8170974.1 hypothetical protein BKA90DRAFT_139958 [Yarrowia lipolytica]KAJ8051511.1 hypothetical protein LXG23DRAFT_39215 [Yarrowia lipolytica]QNP95141.1 Hypothetical protein YALI2_A00140g [Yarrowia lipolytica]RDW23025.1 hypothetical protein B0I71DRAFT_136632 [Yarrowia lipolytica]